MKKYIFLLSIIYFIFQTTNVVYSVTPTPFEAANKSNQTEILNQQINLLKDKIASRVAELKLVERRGVVGNVTDISDTQITISDVHGNTRFIDVDELTKFSSPSAKGSFGISDISKGTTLGILGLYNKQSSRILARFVDVTTVYKTFQGVISSVDADNYTVSIVLKGNKKITIDIENTTKTSSYTKSDGITKSGFSKLKEGARILVVGFPDVKNKNNIIASRILIFPELQKNPNIVLPVEAEHTVSSTGSGKKLTPLRK